MDQSYVLEQIGKAEQLYTQQDYTEAMDLYQGLCEIPVIGSFCKYRLASIHNINQNPEKAYELYYAALEEYPNILSLLLEKDFENHSYVYSGKKTEQNRTKYPLCGKESLPYWCYYFTRSRQLP